MSKITYANKVAINENAEIADINKVTDSDMNEIKAVVNNNDDDLITINTKLTNLITYSTTETVVGTWIDGKPIYRKVINSTIANIQSLINNLNIDTPIRFNGLADSKYGYAWAENTRYTAESGYSNVYHWSQSKPRTISWEFESYYENNRPVMVILEYTKTTD